MDLPCQRFGCLRCHDWWSQDTFLQTHVHKTVCIKRRSIFGFCLAPRARRGGMPHVLSPGCPSNTNHNLGTQHEPSRPVASARGRRPCAPKKKHPLDMTGHIGLRMASWECGHDVASRPCRYAKAPWRCVVWWIEMFCTAAMWKLKIWLNSSTVNVDLPVVNM